MRNLTKSLGNGESGVFGAEARPRGLGSLAESVDADLASGRHTPASYRRAACKSLVAGFASHRDRESGFRVLDDDRAILKARSKEAEAVLDAVVARGIKSLSNPRLVEKSFSPAFAGAVNGLNRLSPQAMVLQQMGRAWSKEISKAVGKSFSLTSPLSSGFVPFDLMPFVRTIYPVYTPLRAKIPRVPGQGTFHRGKILASVSGSLPGGLGALQDDSTSEFFGGSGFSSWPNPLPAAGSQTSYELIIPYRFFALTEATSWLAQFSGQGFDDIYGLASLVLLQEFMLLEEHDLIASSSQSLAQPAAPTCVARAAGTGETAITFTGTNVYVTVTAINYWGETAYSASLVTDVSTATSGSSVIDVTIAPVTGALMYVIYVGYGTSQPARTGFFAFTTNTQGGWVGGVKFTLQGALPTTGNSPQAADSGTGASTRQESMVSIMSGLAYNGGAGPYPNIAAGYFANDVGLQLTVDVLSDALQKVYNGPGAYLANPSEVVTSPTDAAILAKSIRDETVAAYQFRVQQSEMAGVTAGIAVANVVNPVTRSAPEILVHPYLTQGTAMGLSYTLPQTQNNLGNVWENVMVQDYAQIGWPVIDPTFRQSILRYGTLFGAAPQYNFLLQGLQVQDAAPYK